MAKFAHADVLDNGLAYIKANCTKVVLVSAYSVSDSYATVIGNLLAEATVSTTNFTLGSSSLSRTLTFAAGSSDSSANASGGGAGNHIAFVDVANSKVLWVTAETSVQAVVAGNPVNFPALVYTSAQPT